MPGKIRERPNVLDPDHDGASLEPVTSNRLRIACGSYVNQVVTVYPITAKTTEFIGVPQKLCNPHTHLPSFDAFSSAIPRAGLRAVLFNLGSTAIRLRIVCRFTCEPLSSLRTPGLLLLLPLSATLRAR
jgi:hypothetical protein